MILITPADLKRAANDLPPSPQVFGKLGKLLRDTSTGLDDITDLVNTDASLTAQVLRLSNSALYGHGIPIDTLDDAINRVGFLLSTWNFPAETIDAIQNQYTPEAATQSKDAAMLNLAALITENLGKALPGESQYWESAETYLQQLGLNGAHLEEAQEYVEETLESVLASVAA